MVQQLSLEGCCFFYRKYISRSGRDEEEYISRGERDEATDAAER
jgi:hypothetical protein